MRELCDSFQFSRTVELLIFQYNLLDLLHRSQIRFPPARDAFLQVNRAKGTVPKNALSHPFLLPPEKPVLGRSSAVVEDVDEVVADESRFDLGVLYEIGDVGIRWNHV